MAEVELAVCDDGVRPGGVVALGRIEAAKFHELLGFTSTSDIGPPSLR